MKSLSLIIVLLFSSTILFAQNEVDALRYSENFNGGTARYMSMGGAFGALGGDLSVLSTNPAGIAVFRTSKFSFTPGMYYNEINSNYHPLLWSLFNLIQEFNIIEDYFCEICSINVQMINYIACSITFPWINTWMCDKYSTTLSPQAFNNFFWIPAIFCKIPLLNTIG